MSSRRKESCFNFGGKRDKLRVVDAAVVDGSEEVGVIPTFFTGINRVQLSRKLRDLEGVESQLFWS